MVAQNVAKKVA